MAEVSITRCLWLSVACGWLAASLLTGEQPFVQPSAAAHGQDARCLPAEGGQPPGSGTSPEAASWGLR